MFCNYCFKIRRLVPTYRRKPPKNSQTTNGLRSCLVAGCTSARGSAVIFTLFLFRIASYQTVHGKTIKFRADRLAFFSRSDYRLEMPVITGAKYNDWIKLHESPTQSTYDRNWHELNTTVLVYVSICICQITPGKRSSLALFTFIMSTFYFLISVAK